MIHTLLLPTAMQIEPETISAKASGIGGVIPEITTDGYGNQHVVMDGYIAGWSSRITFTPEDDGGLIIIASARWSDVRYITSLLPDDLTHERVMAHVQRAAARIAHEVATNPEMQPTS